MPQTPRMYACWPPSPTQAPSLGFLVAHDNPDRPLALAYNPGGSDDRGARRLAVELVRRFAADPDASLDGLQTVDTDQETAYVIDLRAYGEPDSPDPMPGWLYGVEAREVDHAVREVTPGEFWELWPRCWHRAAALAAALTDDPGPTRADLTGGDR